MEELKAKYGSEGWGFPHYSDFSPEEYSQIAGGTALGDFEPHDELKEWKDSLNQNSPGIDFEENSKE